MLDYKNPDLHDPKIEKDTLPEEGSIEAIDIFNGPPAGHSLTGAPGQWPWEKPPEFVTPEDAMEFIVQKVNKPDVKENFLRLLASGVPVEAITNTITFAGFTEGQWTVDTAEILKPPVAMFFIGLAMENDIPATVFNIAPEQTKKDQTIPDEEVLKMMKENRPDMYNQLMLATDLITEGPDEESPVSEQQIEPSEIKQEANNFMDMEEGEI